MENDLYSLEFAMKAISNQPTTLSGDIQGGGDFDD